MVFPPAVPVLPILEQVTAALATVNDPEIHRPITDLGMVKDVSVGVDGIVRVDVWLTVSGCPLRDSITARSRRQSAGSTTSQVSA